MPDFLNPDPSKVYSDTEPQAAPTGASKSLQALVAILVFAAVFLAMFVSFDAGIFIALLAILAVLWEIYNRIVSDNISN